MTSGFDQKRKSGRQDFFSLPDPSSSWCALVGLALSLDPRPPLKSPVRFPAPGEVLDRPVTTGARPWNSRVELAKVDVNLQCKRYTSSQSARVLQVDVATRSAKRSWSGAATASARTAGTACRSWRPATNAEVWWPNPHQRILIRHRQWTSSRPPSKHHRQFPFLLLLKPRMRRRPGKTHTRVGKGSE